LQDGGSGTAPEEPVEAPPITGIGDSDETSVEGGGISVHGQADAKYNGGSWSVQGQKVTTSDACGQCPPGTKCLHMTGTLVTNYSVGVNITLPAVPAGLSKCEAGKVQAFINTTLTEHEQEHERRFKTYNGTTQNPIDVTGCGTADLTQQVKAMEAAEAGPRQAAANSLSGAIDPFTAQVDTSDCTDSS
jgi:hypothetical protein